MNLRPQSQRVALQLTLEAKYLDLGHRCLKMGPLEFAIGAGDGIQLSVEDPRALRALREILCCRDLNWFGNLTFSGADGRGLPASELFELQLLGELSEEAQPSGGSARQVLEPVLTRYSQKSLQRAGVDQLLGAFGLDHVGDLPCANLAGAERQRLNLALMSLMRPRVVLIDCSRPLRPENRPVMQEVLLEMAQAGASLILLEGAGGSWELFHIPRIRLPLTSEIVSPGTSGSQRPRRDADEEWLERLESEIVRGSQLRSVAAGPQPRSWAVPLRPLAAVPRQGVGLPDR